MLCFARLARSSASAIVLAALGLSIGCQGTQLSGSPQPLLSTRTVGTPTLLGSGPLLGSTSTPVASSPTPSLFGGSTAGTPTLFSAIGGGKPNLINPANKAPEVDFSQLPRELSKVTMPAHVVEPPDILLIDAQRLIPKGPYYLRPLDSVAISLGGLSPELPPLEGVYQIDPEGTVRLLPDYRGPVRIADMTIAEVEKLLKERLAQASIFNKEFVTKQLPNLRVELIQSTGMQAIRGEHLVRPDGTVNLGQYGQIYVAGMTPNQIKLAIEQHLSRYLERPEVNVDIFAYNSKYYYVITDFAGSGEQVQRLPITGNETVLDAMALIGGLSAVSTKTIWVARPAPDGHGDQVLPIDWKGITRRGATKTNYQLLPGDRVFIMGQPLTKFDTLMGRSLAPVERAFGTGLLGYSTIETFRNGTGGLFGGAGGIR